MHRWVVTYVLSDESLHSLVAAICYRPLVGRALGPECGRTVYGREHLDGDVREGHGSNYRGGPGQAPSVCYWNFGLRLMVFTKDLDTPYF